MLFSEVYGTYYNVLAKLLAQAVDGTLTRESMNTIKALKNPFSISRKPWKVKPGRCSKTIAQPRCSTSLPCL